MRQHADAGRRYLIALTEIGISPGDDGAGEHPT